MRMMGSMRRCWLRMTLCDLTLAPRFSPILEASSLTSHSRPIRSLDRHLLCTISVSASTRFAHSRLERKKRNKDSSRLTAKKDQTNRTYRKRTYQREKGEEEAEGIEAVMRFHRNCEWMRNNGYHGCHVIRPVRHVIEETSHSSFAHTCTPPFFPLALLALLSPFLLMY